MQADTQSEEIEGKKCKEIQYYVGNLGNLGNPGNPSNLSNLLRNGVLDRRGGETIDVSKRGQVLPCRLPLLSFTPLHFYTLFIPYLNNLGSLGVYGVLIIPYFLLIHMNYSSTRVCATHESRIE